MLSQSMVLLKSTEEAEMEAGSEAGRESERERERAHKQETDCIAGQILKASDVQKSLLFHTNDESCCMSHTQDQKTTFHFSVII